ncbi:hypothetical protein AB0L06_30780 [Spirillospora sp. NPDC052269]
MYFSEAFNIENPEDFDWFDALLERDTLLFVDPFLIFSDEDPRWNQAHDSMMDYFHNAFELLARSGLKQSHQYYRRTLSLMEFPEPREFRLGYVEASSNGSGNGRGLAKKVVEAMSEAIKRGLEDIRHFEELGILVPGIDKDRISDVTCNLLKPNFIEYTQHACHSLGIAMQEVMVPHGHFDESRRRWTAERQLLPVDPDTQKPILLTPKRFLRELPTLSASSWYDSLDDSLRLDLNLHISENVRKKEIISAARSSQSAVRAWIETQESRGSKPYDVDRDPKLLVKWRKVAKDALRESDTEHLPSITNIQELMDFVEEVIERFRQWVENKGGWRVFWKNLAKLETIPETNMQLLFLGVVEGYCAMAGVRVDREVETGRGPVDFTFTGDRRMRILLEIKKLKHGQFWNGLHIQTPIYMQGQEVADAIFLVVKDSDTPAMQERWRQLDSEARRVSEETQLNIKVARVDALPKASGSKANEANAT